MRFGDIRFAQEDQQRGKAVSLCLDLRVTTNSSTSYKSPSVIQWLIVNSVIPLYCLDCHAGLGIEFWALV